ncbi:VOC family protein [Actinomycetospora soli]|uniref:VOC family protein n=1 Tax=Actinomycetospora soli TaxID=2893887 RepID=UPI001E63DAEF|nr:VOC family protein [Actinomycetospora soli]MCD2188916.1 VOC family protein [Actinomycetospora soli]
MSPAVRTPGVDHLVVATTSLDEGVPRLVERLGVEPAGRARHDRFGTHNALWNLDDGTYLELIAIDPEAPAPGRPRWFDLDRFAGPPRLVHWVLRLPTLSSASDPVLRLTRDDLSWSLTVPDDGSFPGDGSGVRPSLIAWDGGHPSTGLADGGLALSRLVLSTPSAGDLRARLVAAGLVGHLGNRVTVTPGPVALRAELTTPGGPVAL